MAEPFAWFGPTRSTLDVVRWEHPVGRGRCVYRGVLTDRPDGRQAAALRGRPHEWAVIFEGGFGDVTIFAHEVKRGGAPFKYPGQFEVITRRRDNVGVIYARYVGPTL